MRSFISKFLWLPICFGLVGCDVNFSASPGGIEDQNKPKIDPNLAPIPDGYLDFAREAAVLFFGKGHQGVQDRFHPVLENISRKQWNAVEKFVAKEPDFKSMEYYGHGYGENQGLDLIDIQFKIPFDGGYNLVKLTMLMNEECCRLAGIEVEKEWVKSFRLGGE